jgi:hypothetical protein
MPITYRLLLHHAELKKLGVHCGKAVDRMRFLIARRQLLAINPQ